MKKILIIYYHDIVPDGEGNTYQKLEISKFAQQMRFLRDQQYNSILFPEIGDTISENTVIASFDDGFRSIYEQAAPIMKQYGIKGNVYLPTAYIGTHIKFMDWEMVKELQKSGDWYFAAHTHTHVDIRTLNEERAEVEIRNSHQFFQNKLGYVPKVFCIPYGAFDRKSAQLIRRMGDYDYMLGSFYGRFNPSEHSPSVLPRIGISNDDSLDTFANKLNGKYDWKGPLQRARLFVSTCRGERVVQYDF